MIPVVDKERMEAIMDVCALKLEPAGIKFARLLDILIGGMREQNDTVEKDSLLRNQGKIAGWIQIRDYITKGFPDPKRHTRPDADKPSGY